MIGIAQLGTLPDDDLRALVQAAAAECRRRWPSEPTKPSPLTLRETEALRALSRGLKYKQIAAEWGVSVSTVRSHLHAAYSKLNVFDRAQAVLLAKGNGWL